jgi:hypothetical protein
MSLSIHYSPYTSTPYPNQLLVLINLTTSPHSLLLLQHTLPQPVAGALDSRDGPPRQGTLSLHTVLTTHCTHYTLYSLHTVLTTHCAHYTLCSLHTVLTTHCTHYTLCSLHTVLTAHCTHYTLYSLHSVLTAHCTHYTLYSLHTVLTTHCTHYTLYSLPAKDGFGATASSGIVYSVSTVLPLLTMASAPPLLQIHWSSSSAMMGRGPTNR